MCEKTLGHRKKMSIRSYFKPACSLPTPVETGIGAVATKEANRAVQRVLDEQSSQQPSPKRRKYTTFNDEQRARVGKYAAENGNTAALRKFRSEMPSLGESTVRFFKKRYLYVTLWYLIGTGFVIYCNYTIIIL